MKRFARFGGMGLTLTLTLILAGCYGPSDGKRNAAIVAVVDSNPIKDVPKPVPISALAAGTAAKKAPQPKPEGYATKYGSIKGRLVWGGD